MPYVFAVEDPLGRAILLDQSNWDKHAAYRPELLPYLEAIKSVIVKPHVIMVDGAGIRHYYRKNMSREPRFYPLFLHLVVREFPFEWKLLSWRFERNVEEGDVEWLDLTV